MADPKLKKDLAEKEELLKTENEYIQIFKTNPEEKKTYHLVIYIKFISKFKSIHLT